MKRWGYLIAGVLAVALLSGKGKSGVDIARLQPVEVVAVTRSDGQVQIQTDTGDTGTGDDLTRAVEKLKATTSAEVFLETAEYLLISEECANLVPELMEYLRPSCTLCILDGEPAVADIAAFLRIHSPNVTLTEYKAGIRDLQTLCEREGRMELVS